MMLPSFWQLNLFGERLDIWAADQDGSDELRRVVTLWIFTRFDDPYLGVKRRPEVAPNYWFGQVQGTLQNDSVVTCGYWIQETERIVRCDNFATLVLPL